MAGVFQVPSCSPGPLVLSSADRRLRPRGCYINLKELVAARIEARAHCVAIGPSTMAVGVSRPIVG